MEDNHNTTGEFLKLPMLFSVYRRKRVVIALASFLAKSNLFFMGYFQNKKICITGIGGFIGSRLAEIFSSKGAIVSGIEANPEKAKLLETKGFLVAVGSTSDSHLLEKCIRGCDFVLHTAAIVQEGGDLEEFRNVNVYASAEVARIAKKEGVRAMVHFSSVMVYGFTYPAYITEDGELRGENNPYCMTKIEGERELLKMMDSSFGVILIRPGDVYGPQSIPWVVRPLELMEMGLFSLPDGGSGTINLTYVDNLVHGVSLSLEKEAYGEAFNLTDGETLTWKEYFSRLAEAGGYSSPMSLPSFLIQILVQAVGVGYQLFGKTPPVSAEGVQFLLRQNPVSIEKAKNVLGYHPIIPMTEGIRTTMDWVKQEYKSKG
jgi:nucleoside-diphosphate-sugar epimerase